MTLFAVFFTLVFLYSLVSTQVEKLATAPIVFTLAGAIAPNLFPEFLAEDYQLKNFLWVAELGLVLLLFTDACRTDLSLLKKIRALPTRLLGPGLLMTMVLGVLAALLILDQLSFWEACILAAILTPTDASLGQVIVDSPKVPARVREALSVEAGLNDGLSVPFLLFFMAMLQLAGAQGDARLGVFVGQQLGLGILLGGAIGGMGGVLLQHVHKSSEWREQFLPRAIVALPVLCFIFSEEIGTSMFIAAFVAGLAVRATFSQAGKHALDLAAQWGQMFNLGVFFLFGILLNRVWVVLQPEYLFYALVSLTAVRMVPVALALAGSGLDRASVLFIGWFGPRGMASIVLGLVFLQQEIKSPGENIIHRVVICTVLLSILLHGLSARPGIAWYARRLPEKSS